MHGAALPAHMEHAHAAANMPMPTTDAGASQSASRAGHGDTGSPHAAHQCTCPGSCCASAPAALLGHTLRPVLSISVAIRVDSAAPADTIELVESPQLALPFPNAPPAFRIALQSAAQHTT
jgi:hypothetical protein